MSSAHLSLGRGNGLDTGVSGGLPLAILGETVLPPPLAALSAGRGKGLAFLTAPFALSDGRGNGLLPAAALFSSGAGAITPACMNGIECTMHEQQTRSVGLEQRLVAAVTLPLCMR